MSGSQFRFSERRFYQDVADVPAGNRPNFGGDCFCRFVILAALEFAAFQYDLGGSLTQGSDVDWTRANLCRADLELHHPAPSVAVEILVQLLEIAERLLGRRHRSGTIRKSAQVCGELSTTLGLQ